MPGTPMASMAARTSPVITKQKNNINYILFLFNSVAEPPLFWAAPDGQGLGADSGGDQLGSWRLRLRNTGFQYMYLYINPHPRGPFCRRPIFKCFYIFRFVFPLAFQRRIPKCSTAKTREDIAKRKRKVENDGSAFLNFLDSFKHFSRFLRLQASDF